MEEKQSIFRILPILFAFLIMGFCDLVGIATSYMKYDFGLTETLAGFIPSMVFFWFLLFSVPSAMLMNRLGRKNMVLLSNAITFIGMTIPYLHYNFVNCIIGFVFLGIGNAILQVSLNPLLSNVLKGNALTSSLTGGQVVKALSSFSAPFIAAYVSFSYGSWQFIFPVFAITTLLSTFWLLLTPIEKEELSTSHMSVFSAFRLLKDRKLILLFLGIAFVVGVDVGMNTVTPKLLIERAGLSIETAGFGSSIYFLCRTAGGFIGVFLLNRMSDTKYFRLHSIFALSALILLIFFRNEYIMLLLVGIIGYACSSIFPIIYSQAIRLMPHKANEISGLMITGVFGGAIIPPLMGAVAVGVGSQVGSLLVIVVCIVYLVLLAFRNNEAHYQMRIKD